MIRTYLVFICIVFSSFSYGQSNQLVYKKFLSASGYGVKSFPDNTRYLIPYHFSNNSASDSVDLGIWTEDFAEITNASNDTVYWNRIVLYDNQLNIINSLPLDTRASSYPSLHTMQFAQTSNLRSVLYYSNFKLPLAPYQYNNLSGVYTPFLNFTPSESTQCIFIEYHPESNSLSELFNYTEPDSYAEPYPGYFRASYDQFALRKHVGQVFNILNDHTLVAYLSLYKNQFIKTPSETIDFTSWNGQENLIRVEYDLNSGQILTEQIGSSTGNLSTFVMQPSKDLSNLYRIGLVRGNNTPISVSGNELEMAPNDSLYHVFITKEDAMGNSQWITELYAYNNTDADTLINLWTEGMGVRNRFHSIIEKNNEIFVSSTVKVESVENDTLLYRDFLGQDFLYRYYVPNYWMGPSGLPGQITFDQVSFSERAVYKLAENGSVIKKLSHTNKISGHETVSLYAYQNIPSAADQWSNLFEIGDKLAWVNYYYAENDSVGKFSYQSEDGSESTVSLDLPAGMGAYILWLDTDLNIIDNWVFPVQYNSNEVLYLYGLINSVMAYTQDTLLIQGGFPPGATMNLDPSGIAPHFTTQIYGSYIAFYADSETSVTPKQDGENLIKIFPNPTNDVLNIAGINSNTGFYKVLDLSGRTVLKGSLESFQINTQGLKPGMYILSIESEKGKGVEKFVVR